MYSRNFKRKPRRIADSAAFYCDSPRDPTGTLRLRRSYSAAGEMRWNAMRRMSQDAIVQQNMLGLGATSVMALAASFVGQALGLGGSTDSKIRSFQLWFDGLLARTVLEGNGGWLEGMISGAYDQGIATAKRLSKSTATPLDRDEKIALLRAAAFSELQGIVEAVSQKAVREVSWGLLHSRRPSQLFRFVSDAILKVGAVRTRAMVDTLVVKTYGVATLDQFRVAGIKQVGLVPETQPLKRKRTTDAMLREDESKIGEARRKLQLGAAWRQPFAPDDLPVHLRRDAERILDARRRRPPRDLVNVLTAGDDDVCQECQDISDDGPYTLDEADELIPAHPHCRCAFVPVFDLRFAVQEVLGDADELDLTRAENFVWKEGDLVIGGVQDEFDPNEERDPDGKWTTGGGSGAPAPAEEAKGPRPAPKAEAKQENERNLTKPLDKREEMALTGYSKNLSQDINKDLRGQERTGKAIKNNPDAVVKDYTKAMDSAFDKASTQKDMTTFRAVSPRTWEKMQASGEFHDKGFVSTSASSKVADTFGKEEFKGKHQLVNLDIPKGSKAIYMADKSNHAGEREVLLARGSTWKRGADRDGRPTFVLHHTA